MGQKELDRERYMEKREKLKEMFGEPVAPALFYYDLFPFMSFEGKNEQGDNKPNGILTRIADGNAVNMIVTDDHEMIDTVMGERFVVMPPVSFFGHKRTAEMARYLYAFTFDLDGATPTTIDNLFFQMEQTDIRPPFIPRPTYTVHSGHGLHLYYMLKEPIPLYHHLHRRLNEMKHALTGRIWNRYTSIYKEREQVQYQGIFQGFRMPGTLTKLGKGYPVLAFRTGEKCDLDYLNSFLIGDDEKYRVKDLDYHSRLPLEEAKKRYPKWYQERIIEKKPKGAGRWTVNRALYDWWIRKIKEGATVGHRYHCITVLATYAIKCSIPFEELKEDALKLIPFMNQLNKDPVNDIFTKRDVLDALRMYEPSFANFSRAEAERISGIRIEPNKRNGRPQALHLKIARATQDVIDPTGEWHGRKSVEYVVKQWRALNPDGTKKQCQEDTGLTQPTIRKWWGEPPRKYEHRELVLKGWTEAENARRTQRGEFSIPEFDNK